MTHVSFFIAKNVSIRNLLQYIIFPFFIMLKCGVFVAVVDLMRIVRKPVFGVSDQVTHKPGRTAIRVARGLKFRRDCSSCRAKTKALISCAVDLRLCFCIYIYMSLVVRKPVFGVSDQVPHKPGCTAREDG